MPRKPCCSSARIRVYATHQGVKAEFARLAKSDTRIELKHTAFLARAYSLKSAADYETGAAANVTAAQASDAIGLAGGVRCGHRGDCS